jgi:hypothetical protein
MINNIRELRELKNSSFELFIWMNCELMNYSQKWTKLSISNVDCTKRILHSFIDNQLLVDSVEMNKKKPNKISR